MNFEEETLLLLLLRRRKRRRRNRSFWVSEIITYKEQSDFFILYPLLRKNNENFFNYFRMSIASFDDLTATLGESVTRKDTVMRKSISAEQRIAMTVRFLATGCSLEDIQYAYRCGITTASEIIKDVCQKIWICMKNKNMPEITREEWKYIADGFKRRAQFPNCLGAVDGKHIRIIQPGESGSTYYNYKNYFSIILLAICDSDYKFRFVDIGSYGRHSDSTIFEESLFYRKLKEKTMYIPEPTPIASDGCALPYVFVGDEAFSLSQNMLRPYPGKLLPENKRIFIYRLTRARRYVECSFGILTAKWRIFHKPINLSISFTKDVIKACCVLHNFVRDRDGFAFEDTLYINGLEDMSTPTITNPEQPLSAETIREKFSGYFNSNEGSIPWQWDKI